MFYIVLLYGSDATRALGCFSFAADLAKIVYVVILHTIGINRCAKIVDQRIIRGAA
jgi:hypothetical protein